MPLDSAVDPNDNEGTLGCWFGIMWGKMGWVGLITWWYIGNC